ncbi:MAG: hypothetical protein MUC77_19960 [Chromatiaceae bacterium]|jgi:hypothetical protein|nr:hypothetical protein [Chromatiaceae bacterium]
MTEQLMVLPSADVTRVRLLRIPQDMSAQEAYRCVTGLIAEVEDGERADWVEGILDTLEGHGFELVDFVLGPSLD